MPSLLVDTAVKHINEVNIMKPPTSYLKTIQKRRFNFKSSFIGRK